MELLVEMSWLLLWPFNNCQAHSTQLALNDALAFKYVSLGHLTWYEISISVRAMFLMFMIEILIKQLFIIDHNHYF